MIIIPVHDMILFPKVNFYFKKDAYRQWSGTEAEAGAEILFLLQRGDKDIKDCTAEDFYPVGMLAEVVGIDSEGLVQIRVHARADVEDIENDGGSLSA